MKKPQWNLEWNDGMSVGIPEIDEDHKRFISLIDELNHSITEKMKATEIQRRLQHVIEDANRHFEQEEKFFREQRYPNAEGHDARTIMSEVHSKKSRIHSFPMDLKRNG